MPAALSGPASGSEDGSGADQRALGCRPWRSAIAIPKRSEAASPRSCSTQGPLFGHNVLREGRRILETDRERRIDFESDTIVRAFDFRPTWELAAREQVGGMRRWLKRYLA
jgi:hypothetical protein